MARIEQVLAGEEPWSAWWLDQLGHTGLGAAYSLPFVAWVLIAGGSTGLAIVLGVSFALFGGAMREVAQFAKSGKLHPWDRFFDVVFHLPGVAVSFGLVKLGLLFF